MPFKINQFTAKKRDLVANFLTPYPHPLEDSTLLSLQNWPTIPPPPPPLYQKKKILSEPLGKEERVVSLVIGYTKCALAYLISCQ